MTVRAVATGSQPRWRTAGLAWGLWALAIVGLVVTVWLDQLLRRAARPELVVLIPTAIPPVLGAVSTATVGALVASRRPHHPVGWLLLGFVLLLTPTGALPSPRWRWWAGITAATPVALLLIVTLLPRRGDRLAQALSSPLDLHTLDCGLLAAYRAAFAVTIVMVIVATASLVERFRRARGSERQQLRRVALATVLVALLATVHLTAGRGRVQLIP
jgi:hypothetical protein